MNNTGSALLCDTTKQPYLQLPNHSIDMNREHGSEIAVLLIQVLIFI